MGRDGSGKYQRSKRASGEIRGSSSGLNPANTEQVNEASWSHGLNGSKLPWGRNMGRQHS
jgi:hypothetical protein